MSDDPKSEKPAERAGFFRRLFGRDAPLQDADDTAPRPDADVAADAAFAPPEPLLPPELVAPVPVAPVPEPLPQEPAVDAPIEAAPTPKRSWFTRLLEPANDVREIPLHGRIAAGLPIEAVEGQTSLAVPAALLGPGDHYALEVAGDSMVEAGILDGDYALVRRVDTAHDGEIVVALIDDAEATLKYFRKEGSMVRLDPANRAYDPQRYRPGQVRIQGKLSGLLRRY